MCFLSPGNRESERFSRETKTAASRVLWIDGREKTFSGIGKQKPARKFKRIQPAPRLK
jgi:hypothetical protein